MEENTGKEGGSRMTPPVENGCGVRKVEGGWGGPRGENWTLAGKGGSKKKGGCFPGGGEGTGG